MKAMRFLMLAAGLAMAAGAQAGDPAVGERLVTEKDCAACHKRLIGGDGSKLYLRSDRKVKSLPQLHAQVSFCATQLKTGWFPEDEEDVVAWLNHRYYHFK
ncbi:MAG: cytochrome c [Zoogloea sp.]|nr:cytochrome c [Zoogloea sp.]